MNTDFEQLGGFDTVEFYLLSETANWPLVVNDQTASQITYLQSLLDNYGVISSDTIDVNINTKQSSEGTIYPIEIVFQFSNRTEALENYLDSYQNKPIIAIATLNTGFKKLYGTNEEPLILNYKIDEGKKPEDLGIISVSIKGETRNRPVFFNV